MNIAFSDTDDFTYVRSEPDENSDWTGKLYKDSTVEVPNIWMAGQRSGQVRQKDMFPQKSCLQEKMPVFIQGVRREYGNCDGRQTECKSQEPEQIQRC